MNPRADKAALSGSPTTALLRYLAHPAGPLHPSAARGHERFRARLANIAALVRDELQAACESGALPESTVLAQLVELPGERTGRGVRFDTPIVVRRSAWARIWRAYIHAISFNFAQKTTSFHKQARAHFRGTSGAVGLLTSQTLSTDGDLGSDFANFTGFLVDWKGTDHYTGKNAPELPGDGEWPAIDPGSAMQQWEHKHGFVTESGKVIDWQAVRAGTDVLLANPDDPLALFASAVKGNGSYICNMGPLVREVDVVLATPVIYQDRQLGGTGLTVALARSGSSRVTRREIDSVYLVACRLHELVLTARAHLEADMERQRLLEVSNSLRDTTRQCVAIMKDSLENGDRRQRERTARRLFVINLLAEGRGPGGSPPGAPPPVWSRAGLDNEDLGATLKQGYSHGGAWNFGKMSRCPAHPGLLALMDTMFTRVHALADEGGARLQVDCRLNSGRGEIDITVETALRLPDVWNDFASFVSCVAEEGWLFDEWENLRHAGLVFGDRTSVEIETGADQAEGRTLWWNDVPVAIRPVASRSRLKPGLVWRVRNLLFKPAP